MSNNISNYGSEYAAIAQVLQHYVDGARSGRGDDMKPAFHEAATVFGYVGSDLFAGPVEQLYAWNDENGAATDLQASIAGVDVQGTVANGTRRARQLDRKAIHGPVHPPQGR